ncbi:hypothetical protein HDE_12997 [Halotydeus destructor]|nr:hypothetical protein HDE_12997 [Halotydeus destructor]
MACSSSSLSLSLTIFAAIFASGYAIQCWDCQSNYNPGCGSNFDNSSFAMVDCDQKFLAHLPNNKATVCRKITQKVQDDEQPRTIRGCGFLEDGTTDGQCVRRSGTFSVLVEYCTCSTDGCNSARGSSPQYIAYLALGSLLVAFFSSRRLTA